MAGQFSSDFTDPGQEEANWEQMIYAPSPQLYDTPPAPAYDPAQDRDPWEAPAMADAGLSSISGQPYDGGYAIAAPDAPIAAPEVPMAPQMAAPEPPSGPEADPFNVYTPAEYMYGAPIQGPEPFTQAPYDLSGYEPQPAYQPEGWLPPEWAAQDQQDFYGGQPDYGVDIFPPDPGSATGAKFNYDEYGNITGMTPEWSAAVDKGFTLYPNNPDAAYRQAEALWRGGPQTASSGITFNSGVPLDPSQVQDNRYLGGDLLYSPDFLRTLGGRSLVGSLVSKLNPFDNKKSPFGPAPEPVPLDPNTGLPLDNSLFQQFGFGAEGGLGLTGYKQDANRAILSNPQFRESNAQFDATTAEGNRGNLSIADIGKNIASQNWDIPIYSDFAREQLIPGVAGALNAQNPLTYLDNPVGNFFRGGNEEVAKGIVPVNLPQVALTAAPLLGKLGEGGLMAERTFGGGLLGSNLDTLPQIGNAVHSLTDLAPWGEDAAQLAKQGFSDNTLGKFLRGDADSGVRLPNVLENPAAAGGESVIIPRALPASEAVKFPGGLPLGGGAADDAARFLDRVIADNPGQIADNIAAMRAGGVPDQNIVDFIGQQANDLGAQARALGRGAEDVASPVADLKGALQKDLGIDSQAARESASTTKPASNIKAYESTRWPDLEDAVQAEREALINETGTVTQNERWMQEAGAQRAAQGGGNLAGVRARMAAEEAARAAEEASYYTNLEKGYQASVEAAQAAARANPENANATEALLSLVKPGDTQTAAAIAEAAKKPGIKDMVREVWFNSVLSNPVTHAKNLLSNSVTAMLSPIERATSAAVEIPLHRIQGRATERFFQEAAADGIGAMRGIPDGIRAAMYTAAHGVRPGDASKVEFEPAIPGIIGSAIRTPSRLLEAADAMNFGINYRSALEAGAVRIARSEGLKGDALVARIADLTSNPPEALTAAAKQVADYRIFRAKPGEITNALLNVRNKVPGLDFVIPFLTTPINLFKFGIERSPAGFLDPALWRNLKNGSPEASDQIARALIGTGAAAALAYAFAEDKITGAVPSTEGARDRFFREGKQPFSIKVGGQWISYQSFEPLNTTLSMVGSAIDAARDGGSTQQKVKQAVSNIESNLVDNSYLRGLSDFLDMMADPDTKFEKWAQGVATGFVPFSGALRFGTQLIDSTQRDPEGWAETFMANIPGLSDNVPARQDAFGNEVQRPGIPGSPIRTSSDIATNVDKELGRVGVEIGFVGDSIKGEEPHDLTREQQMQYQELAGQASYRVIQELISTQAYQRLSDEDKAKAVKKAITLSRDATREWMLDNVLEPK